MDTYLDGYVSELKGMNPQALAGLKKVFWEGTENWDALLNVRAAVSGQLVLSDFSKNAIKGFLKS